MALKAAVAHLTKQQACELGEYGIRVNCVAPGPVKTKLSIAVHTPEIIQAYHDAVPLNRYGSERELAEVIYFLCSPRHPMSQDRLWPLMAGLRRQAWACPPA